MFVSMKEIVDKAYAGKYGVPAVGGGNENMVRAAIEAAEETNSPLIIISGNRGTADPMFYGAMVKQIANQAAVPVALCLDHSPSFEDAMLGIRAGYSAVMVDRSMLPYEENVAQVKEIVRIAHSVGVTVEAELGHVGQGSNYAVDGSTALTDPEQAKRYIEETGVDCLAVAIGTAHGAYVGVPKLRFELLEQIDRACGTPLVLHGGSGSGDENIHKACSMGVSKVNIVNDLMQAAVRAASAGDWSGNAAYRFFPSVYQAVKDHVKHCFDITGCTGKAWYQVPRLVGKAIDIAEAH
jgi:fructose-bisphosphate aldolase class II